MRFQVPQFIEVEDKIVGPLTFKQFLYIGGTIAIGVILFLFLPRFFAFVLAIPVIAFGFALAFYKVNERPFTQLIEDFLHFSFGDKLYVWQKTEEKPEARVAEKKPDAQVYVPKLSESKLKDLSLALDISNPEKQTIPTQSLNDKFRV